MPVLSRFNDAGQAEFELFLDRLREDPYTVPPIEILTDSRFSELLTHSVEIDAEIASSSPSTYTMRSRRWILVPTLET